MKLEPVFVVAPVRGNPSMSTRRAFLIAGGTFALGTSLGGACGYSVGVGVADAAAKPSEAAPVEEELKPSGDVELDELRRLAVKAPIEELLERRMVFVAMATRTYVKDEVVWRGMGRLADAVITNEKAPDRRILARFLAQEIERCDTKFRALLLPKIVELRKVK